MKSVKTMAALLVASTLGLGGVAIAATQDTEGGGSRRQAATESTDEGRQRRSERTQTTDSARQGERRQRQAAGSDNDTGDRVRADRSDRSDRNRSDRQARASDGRKDRGLGRREPQRARADRGTDRRYSNNGRYTGHDRRSLNRQNDRSHDGARYAGHDRRKEHSRSTGGRKGGFGSRVDRRLSNQQARIRSGRHSGELSRGEVKRLRKDQNKIARMDRRFGSDGRYTKVERRKLNKAMDRASNRVYRAKNNDRVASRSGGHKRNW